MDPEEIWKIIENKWPNIYRLLQARCLDEWEDKPEWLFHRAFSHLRRSAGVLRRIDNNLAYWTQEEFDSIWNDGWGTATDPDLPKWVRELDLLLNDITFSEEEAADND